MSLFKEILKHLAEIDARLKALETKKKPAPKKKVKKDA